jgi:hypothetical protein
VNITESSLPVLLDDYLFFGFGVLYRPRGPVLQEQDLCETLDGEVTRPLVRTMYCLDGKSWTIPRPRYAFNL